MVKNLKKKRYRSKPILNDAILYFKEENKRCSEMDTQPLLKYFISGDGPLLKREEKKLQMWTENDHIPNGRFSDTKQLWCRRSKYAILNPKTSLWDSSCRHNKILSLVASFFAAAWSKNKLQVIVGTGINRESCAGSKQTENDEV
ncbi:unnamed protein product [Eruca vesicaria subsp. sativa]|uniref:Uncharacterized protein n=1 Tax=Eruca vesicaria subsp. sativa TaxID=29727 RepID=A0ABC8KQS2_ERUVS|nr:unnamed protein product [Eruca vesicaria subsp. sativa]